MNVKWVNQSENLHALLRQWFKPSVDTWYINQGKPYTINLVNSAPCYYNNYTCTCNTDIRYNYVFFPGNI